MCVDNNIECSSSSINFCNTSNTSALTTGSNALVGIYIGIVALILILIGIFSKNYKIMTTVGIIVTVINILYQLNYLWGTIPFWLYLLLGGLVLIGLVTYKELK